MKIVSCQKTFPQSGDQSPFFEEQIWSWGMNWAKPWKHDQCEDLCNFVENRGGRTIWGWALEISD
jgi:hypothetical protein